MFSMADASVLPLRISAHLASNLYGIAEKAFHFVYKLLTSDSLFDYGVISSTGHRGGTGADFLE